MKFIKYDENCMRVLLNESVFDVVGDWRYNAVCFGFRTDGLPYLEGYFEAADYLVDHFLDMTQDFAVYPTMFLYRHYIELGLKNILYLLESYHDIQRQEPLIEHQLTKIWKLVKPLLKKCEESFDDEHLEGVEKVIIDFDKFDAGSLTFRYPVTKNNSPSMEEHTRINLLQVQKIVRILSSYINMISNGLYAEVELKADYESEMRSEMRYETY